MSSLLPLSGASTGVLVLMMGFGGGGDCRAGAGFEAGIELDAVMFTAYPL